MHLGGSDIVWAEGAGVHRLLILCSVYGRRRSAPIDDRSRSVPKAFGCVPRFFGPRRGLARARARSPAHEPAAVLGAARGRVSTGKRRRARFSRQPGPSVSVALAACAAAQKTSFERGRPWPGAPFSIPIKRSLAPAVQASGVCSTGCSFFARPVIFSRGWRCAWPCPASFRSSRSMSPAFRAVAHRKRHAASIRWNLGPRSPGVSRWRSKKRTPRCFF